MATAWDGAAVRVAIEEILADARAALYAGAAGVLWALRYQGQPLEGDLGVAVYLRDCLRAEARFPTVDVF